MSKREVWLALGDIHGRWQEIRSLNNYLLKMHSYHHPSNTYLLLLGDVGANFFYADPFSMKRDDDFKKKLGKYDFQYICLRGNHEQRPSNMKNLKFDEWDYIYKDEIKGMVYIEKKYPYIWYLDDKPAIYEFGELHTLTLPGAYSVDKYYRIERGWSWFYSEQMSPEEMDLARKLIKTSAPFDLVLSHTCPQIYEPTDLFLSVVDQSTVDKTMELFFNEIERNLDYKLWLWGHYHATRVYPEYNGKQCVMLFNDHYFWLNYYFRCKNPYYALTQFIDKEE